MASEPKTTLVELLEWRKSAAEWRPSWEYLEELRRLCARGQINEVLGRLVLDSLGIKLGDPQPVPPAAFEAYRLAKEIGSNHGQLHDRLFVPVWVDLRFPNETAGIWQAELEADDIKAPRAAAVVEQQLPPPAPPPSSGSTQPPPTPRAIIRDYAAEREAAGHEPNMDVAVRLVKDKHPKISRTRARELYRSVTGRGVENRGQSRTNPKTKQNQ